MLGLPTETPEDIRGIAELSNKMPVIFDTFLVQLLGNRLFCQISLFDKLFLCIHDSPLKRSKGLRNKKGSACYDLYFISVGFSGLRRNERIPETGMVKGFEGRDFPSL